MPLNVQSNDREAAPEITDATLLAAMMSSHCHQLLEFGRVLPTACTSTTPLLASSEKFGQGDRKASYRDFPYTYVLIGSGFGA